ncbi:MAG: hypothetical protein ABI877_15260, partial [Gemmatimonadaceae bacterium]
MSIGNVHRLLRTIFLICSAPQLLPAQRNLSAVFELARDSLANSVAIQVGSTAASDTVYVRPYRIPAVAGLLSYAFPGMGSFYAGHVRHGVTHVIVAYSIFSLSLQGPGLSEDSSPAFANVLLSGFLLNWGWSIVSAVHDARA